MLTLIGTLESAIEQYLNDNGAVDACKAHKAAMAEFLDAQLRQRGLVIQGNMKFGDPLDRRIDVSTRSVAGSLSFARGSNAGPVSSLLNGDGVEILAFPLAEPPIKKQKK